MPPGQQPNNTVAGEQPYHVPAWFYAFIPNRLGGGLIAPLTPLFIVQVLNGNLADVGWVASLTSLASAPASIIWGNLSDRMQRRLPFMLAGLLAFSLSTILTGIADSIALVLFYSFFVSLLGTAVGPTSSALLIENIPEKQWSVSFGWFNQIGGLSYVAGMLIGTVWLQFLPDVFPNETVMRGLFLFAGGAGLISPLLAMLWIREQVSPLPATVPGSSTAGSLFTQVVERARYFLPNMNNLPGASQWRNLRATFGAALGKYYLYTFILFFGINIAFMPFPLFLSQSLKASNGQVFLINLVKSVVDTFFFVPMGNWMVHRRGLGLQSQAAGLRAVLFAICAALAFFQLGQAGLYAIVVVQVLNGISWAAISVSGPTIVADLSQRGKEARSIGTYNAVMGLAGITGNLAAGYIVQYMGYVTSFSVAAAIMLLTGILLWRLRSQNTSRG